MRGLIWRSYFRSISVTDLIIENARINLLAFGDASGLSYFIPF